MADWERVKGIEPRITGWEDLANTELLGPPAERDFFEVLFEGEWLRVAKCSRRVRFNSAMVCGRAKEPCGPGTINSDWAPARCELQ
jgi:hypothetical protein